MDITKGALDTRILMRNKEREGEFIMYEVLEKIQKIGIVPVVVLNDATDAKPLAQALCDGGLPCAEVTFRTKAAEESIRIMAESFPDMLIGAGTVLTTEQVDHAVAAGAKFIVSPGLNPEVVKYCVDKDIPVTPGTASPSDVEAAISLGLEVVKFFPAESAGGLKMIQALAAPYVNMKFMPTGGINAKNINDYLAFDKIIACGGSWMVSGDLVKAKRFDKIRDLTREAVQTMLGLHLKHIRLNCGDETEAEKAAKIFETLFGFKEAEGNSSFFANGQLEVTRTSFPGEKGQLCIGTNSVLRAMSYLERQGIAFKKDTMKYKDDKLVSVYLDMELSGFAIYLLSQSA